VFPQQLVRVNDKEKNILAGVDAKKGLPMTNPAINPQYRKSDFKIGCVHGRAPTSGSREAQIRNHLYLVGTLTVHHTRLTATQIRIVGYEVPLWQRGHNRDECMDLLGYDATYKPWIIELKQGSSTCKLHEVVSQIDRYAQTFEEGVRSPIEEEIRRTFLWPEFHFSGDVGKMILADRMFFEWQQPLSAPRDDILFCSFARCPSEETLLKSRPAEIGLKVELI